MLTTTGYKIGKQPIAQSFFIDEPNGIYCCKVDLFLKTADENAPIQIQIRPMENGFPSANKILPGSVLSLPGSTFSGGSSVSADATTATTFRFDEPVYLKGNTDYALMVIADSKDYEIYVAQINEFVVGSTEKRVNKQPILGSLFYSQNGTTFTPAQNQDLTFKLYKAKFKHQTGTIRLHNAPVPRKLLPENPIKTTGGSTTVKVFHPHHGMQVGQSITLSGVDSSGVGGIFASTLNKKYNITAMDFTGYTFTADSAADSDAIGGGTLIQSTKNIQYTTIYPSIASIIPQARAISARVKTTTGKSYAGGETSFQKGSTFERVIVNENNTTDSLKLIAHDSAQTTELGAGVKSLDMEIDLIGADSSAAPMIDLQRTSVGLFSNIIDKQASTITAGFNVPLTFTAETNNIGGSSPSKHLTVPITLGAPSVGLRVLIEANRPQETDFELYFRTAAEDELIRDKDFTLAPAETNIPSDENDRVFRQYRYLIGGQGGDLSEFVRFQLKVVFRSTNQAKVPVIRSLRAIALSV